MFEIRLRKALQHFDYDSANKVWEAVNEAELNKRYQVTDEEDELYWELDKRLEQAEKSMIHANGNKPKLVERGDVVKVYD